jgi:predicted  nucleic acid-binding Zn-ribbon protein
MAEELIADRRRAEDEWRQAPTDDALRAAHLAAAAAAREVQTARVRLAEAEDRCRAAEQALKAARERLAADAADMRLPESAEALHGVEAALDRYRDALSRIMQAGDEVRRAVPELHRCRMRADEARKDHEAGQERAEAARAEADEAAARLATLRGTVGAKVEDLMRQLAEARRAAEAAEGALDGARADYQAAGQARAVAGAQTDAAHEALQQRSEARAEAVAKWQQFAATGLLPAAIPDIELPEMRVPWTIDPALMLARRTEQALAERRDDDETWSRVQRQMNDEYAELQRALGALGHQAVADVGDWGLVVHIIYQNRPERPDRLSARLADEIAQRSELLTAREREVLENHLQAEIAAEIQRLLQSAERQRDAINRELYKRPTSTGVRFRLIWQTRSEDEGAPVGLEAARKRLLNTSADLWSVEDRSVVGAMLQRCILAERERADASGSGASCPGRRRAANGRWA